MKKIALFSLLMACLPFMTMAQNDDLYFIPKKKVEKKEKVTTSTTFPVKTVEAQPLQPSIVTTEPVSPAVVVKDVNGTMRDVDEYNRRYTSRDNTFSYENDTLYIEEKPYYERGEWVNGFEGSPSDYDYAMRIIRFRNPRYAVSVSSPFYWDVMSLGYSWDWNVFDDGYYVYAFPTYTNRLWWDWRYNYSWHSPWYYGNWYGWGFHYGSHWGGHWGHPHHFHHHHHHAPLHGGVGGYWGKNHGWYGSSAHHPGIHSGRYASTNYRKEPVNNTRGQVHQTTRNSRDRYVGTSRNSRTQNGNTVRNERNSVRKATSGRVVRAKDASSSVRPQRSATRRNNGESVNTRTSNVRSSDARSSNVRSNAQYTRQNQGRSSSYNRASSTRSTVTNPRSSNNSSRGSSYQSRSTSGSSRSNASYNSGSSRSSSSRSSATSGGGRSSGGGSSRSSGGRR